jgi:hypothetical protein
VLAPITDQAKDFVTTTPSNHYALFRSKNEEMQEVHAHKEDV